MPRRRSRGAVFSSNYRRRIGFRTAMASAAVIAVMTSIVRMPVYSLCSGSDGSSQSSGARGRMVGRLGHCGCNPADIGRANRPVRRRLHRIAAARGRHGAFLRRCGRSRLRIDVLSTIVTSGGSVGHHRRTSRVMEDLPSPHGHASDKAVGRSIIKKRPGGLEGCPLSCSSHSSQDYNAGDALDPLKCGNLHSPLIRF
jgi:hypothetical protein